MVLNATREDVEILIELQEIEKGVSRISKVLEGVESEINTRKKKRKDAENELKALESDLAEVRGLYMGFEGELKERDARIKKSEETLKIVKTNTEYQTLLREIDDNRKRNSEAEGQMIDYLDQIEKKEKAVAESRERFEEIAAVTDREIDEIVVNSENERKELESITLQRDKVAVKVKPKLLDRFNRILKQSSGIAIVPLTNATCGGCFMNIPPQKFIEIQRGEALNFCPQCHRMVYYKKN